MNTYSIKDLENLSGIKAHTLRIWEQRYGLLMPKRTATNIRYYDKNDLKLILNIALLKDNLFKISRIATMTEIEIQEEVINLTESKLPNQEQLHSLTVCLIEMEEDMFEKILSSNILKIGFERTMLEVIFPFLKKIGILWQTGAINASQEHFISNLVRKKIFVATDGLYVSPDSGSKKYALFLPEGETHEMSILFANYMLRARKIRTTYLGQSIPLEDMEAYYHTHRPDYLVTSFISSPGPSEVQKYINTLGKTFPDSTILLSGYQAIWNDLKFPKNVRLLKSFKEFIHFVEKEPFSG